MPEVKIRSRRILMGRRSIPLISGEVHYWRLNPLAWKDVLSRVREMGLGIVSTYIPWDFHEITRGHFDFTGKTSGTRDLKAFLDLTRKEGFHVVIRPGPYIYSEWPRDGVPPHAYRHHKLHPEFQKQAFEYLRQVFKVIRPYFASRKKGHILLIQADNEIDCWPDVFGPQYGLNGKPGLFQEFLRKLYGESIPALNQSWGTTYAAFEEAAPFTSTMISGEKGFSLEGAPEFRRHLDYLRFKHHYAARYAAWSVEACRRLGADIPVYLNLYPFFYAQDWADFQKNADAVGVDLYPTNEFHEDLFEHRKFMDKIRYLSSVSKLPFIAEFESGTWHGRHYEVGTMKGNHYRLLALSAMLAGAAGWNWYMLVNRDNWSMAPINEWGRSRPELFTAFKECVSLFNALKPYSLEKLGGVAVTYEPLQYASRSTPNPNLVLQSLYEAGIDYDCWDMRGPLRKKKILFYAGSQWLDVKLQKNLKRYVEEGGTLVAFRNFPRKDAALQPRQEIGFQEPESILFEFKREFRLSLTSGRSVKVTSSVQSFPVIAGAQMIAADMGGHYGKIRIGYIKKIGKGLLIHLGIDPDPEGIIEILKFTGVKPASQSKNPGISTALFKRGQKHYLIAVNNGNESKSAAVSLEGISRKIHRAVDLDTGESVPVTHHLGAFLAAEIPRKDGKVFEIF